MRLLLIKVGKAWNVLRRDGLIRGSRRVSVAFLRLFRRVRPGDILFISNGVGDSARYRTLHVAEELEQNGFRTSVTIQDNPFLMRYADQFSVFVFHRTLYTPALARFMEALKSRHKTIVFETDDLVYDPEFLRHMDYYSQMNTLERELYRNGLGGEILADPYVKTCTTTTAYLADKLRQKGKRVFIVRNKLSREDVREAEGVLRAASKVEGVVRIAYLSGTPSHNQDFATITEPLMEILGRHPAARLVLAGPLDTEDRLNAYAAQIERLPFLPRRAYFREVAGMDVALAPLEVGNPFCESKSELKFFEAGLLGVPTVTAATRTFEEAIEDGIDGFVAHSREEWIEKLESLIMDKGRREAMGRAARETVLRDYTTENGKSEDYYAFLREQIAKP